MCDVEEKGSQVAPDKAWRRCVGAQCWGASIHSLYVDFEDTMEFSRIFESKSYKSTIDTESCSQMKLNRYEDTIKRLTNEIEQGMCKRCEFATLSMTLRLGNRSRAWLSTSSRFCVGRGSWVVGRGAFAVGYPRGVRASLQSLLAINSQLPHIISQRFMWRISFNNDKT